LSAILAADVAGYTRLMETDTDGTVAAWQDAREEVIKPQVAAHSGTIVKLTGDGFLVEFPTVLDAVNCAIAMQSGLVSSRLEFRIGVNLGDIVDDGEDIHGEGVNVAARLEGLAEPGGICISGDVYNQVRNRIEAAFEDMGAQEVKNVRRRYGFTAWHRRPSARVPPPLRRAQTIKSSNSARPPMASASPIRPSARDRRLYSLPTG
jgi:adenylate cyclase